MEISKKLRKERNRIWAQALESGEYTQCRNMLGKTRKKRCCLGVARDVYMRETRAPAMTAGLLSDQLPTKYVAEWFGWTELDPILLLDSDNYQARKSAATLNDMLELNFKEIAKAVRRTFCR